MLTAKDSIVFLSLDYRIRIYDLKSCIFTTQ